MAFSAILEFLIGSSALLIGALYVIGGLIVNLHLATFGVTEYQILRVKYFVVGITYMTNFVAVLVLASLAGFFVLTLEFNVQQLFLIGSLVASFALLWIWGKAPSSKRFRIFLTWRFWVVAGAVAAIYPIAIVFRGLLAPGAGFEYVVSVLQALLAGVLAFVGQTYFYARHLYARGNSIFGSVDTIGMGIPVRVRLALNEGAVPALKELGMPMQGALTLGPVDLLDESDTHYILGIQGETGIRAAKIAKDAVQAIHYV